jgi:stage II sporulation protein D
MSREVAARLLLSVAAAAGFALAHGGGIDPAKTIVDAAPATVRTTLRVGMWTLWHDRDLLLTPAGPNHRITFRSCEQCASKSLNQPATLRAEGEGVSFVTGGKAVHMDAVLLPGSVVLTAHGESVTLQSPIEITAHKGVLSIVVTLPVENYVERVVASESGPADSFESLKALAIVVRSFALHEAHGHANYDLCDSTHCQLLHWGGNSGRRAASHAATLATAGETLWFRGQRALAYFSKDCGGHTASPTEVWPRAQPVSYLPSQPDRYCAAGGGSEWASELTRADLTAALVAAGVARPGWQSLTVASRGASGRVVTLRLDGVEVSAEDFRLAVGEALGWNRLPSTWFEVSRQGDRFNFHGRGMGHGVGLCQKGAAAMAAQGRSEFLILGEYFPGAKAADDVSGIAWSHMNGEGFQLESQYAADAGYLPELARARAEASQRSGLNATEPFTLRAFPSTAAFRNATLAPGWVAAFTEGGWIGTQPLRILAERRLLTPTMLHEFLHALVEREAGSHTPLWLREGLVEAWSEPDAADPRSAIKPTPALAFTLDAIESALAHGDTEAQSEAAHRAAGWYASQMLNRYGRAQVIEWLRSGLPAGIVVGFGQR